MSCGGCGCCPKCGCRATCTCNRNVFSWESQSPELSYITTVADENNYGQGANCQSYYAAAGENGGDCGNCGSSGAPGR